MNRFVFATLMFLAAGAAQAQGVKVSWDKDTTARVTRYELALTETTTTQTIVLATVDVPATSTLPGLVGKVGVIFKANPCPVGKFYQWIVRGKTLFGVVGPWSIPAPYDLRPPTTAPKNVKAEVVTP